MDPKNQLFNVVFVVTKTGKQVLLTSSPVTHKEGTTIISKCTQHKHGRYVLSPVQNTTAEK
jgi:hypothetical protein